MLSPSPGEDGDVVLEDTPWVVMEPRGSAVGPGPRGDWEELVDDLMCLLGEIAVCHAEGHLLGGLSFFGLDRTEAGVRLDPLSSPFVVLPEGPGADLADLSTIASRWARRLDVPMGFSNWVQQTRAEILCDAGSAMRAFRALARRPVLLNEFPEPVVVGPRPTVLCGLMPPAFVGRESERYQLWTSTLRAADDERAVVVVLDGQSGTGTSRLVDWHRRQLLRSGVADVFEVIHEEIPGVAHGVDAALARAMGAGHVGGPEREELLAESLGEMSQGGGPQGDSPGLEARHVRALLELCARGSVASELSDSLVAEALVRWLKARTPGALPVLLFRDVQWGVDELGLVEALPRVPGVGGLVVLVTCRAESLVGAPRLRKGIDRIGALAEAGRIAVGPLGRHETEELLDSMGLREDDLSSVLKLSRGRPLVAVEALRALWRRGQLGPVDGRLALTDGLSGSMGHPPGALAERLESVLGSFDGTRGRAVEAGGALGLVVSRRVWRESCRRLELVPRRPLLLELEAAGLITPDLDGAPGDWRWRHALLPMLLRRRALRWRRLSEIHLACAGAIESLESEVGSVVALRGSVYHQAAAGERTVAQARVERALAHWVRVGDPASAYPMIRLGGELSRVSDHGESDMATAAIALRTAELYWLAGRLEETLSISTRVSAAARRSAWPELEARASLLLARLAAWRGEMALADDRIYQAEVLADELSAPVLAGTCAVVVAEQALSAGRLADAEAQLGEVLDLFVRRGDLIEEGTVRRLLAACSSERGDLDEAARGVSQALVPLAEGGGRLELGRSLLLRGDIARWQGQTEAAEAGYEEAEQHFRGVGSQEVVEVWQRRALLAAELDDWRKARDHAISARAHLETRGALPARVLVELVLAEAAMGMGDRVGAMSELGLAEQMAEHASLNGRDLRHHLRRLSYMAGEMGASEVQGRAEAFLKRLTRRGLEREEFDAHPSS